MSLTHKVHGLLLSALDLMATVTPDTSEEDFRKVERRWAYFKRVAEEKAIEPGEAQAVIGEAYTEPAFLAYQAIRRARYRASERGKAKLRVKRKAYDAAYYEKIKATRSTPEARARLAQKRKEQRQAKKENTP